MPVFKKNKNKENEEPVNQRTVQTPLPSARQFNNNQFSYTEQEVKTYLYLRNTEFPKMVMNYKQALFSNIASSGASAITSIFNNYFHQFKMNTQIQENQVKTSSLNVDEEISAVLISFPNFQCFDNTGRVILESHPENAYIFSDAKNRLFKYFYVEKAINNQGVVGYIYYDYDEGTSKAIPKTAYQSQDQVTELRFFSDMFRKRLDEIKQSQISKDIFTNMKTNPNAVENDGSKDYYIKKAQVYSEILQKVLPNFFFKNRKAFIKELENGGNVRLAEIVNWAFDQLGIGTGLLDIDFKVEKYQIHKDVKMLKLTFPGLVYHSQVEDKDLLVEFVKNAYLYYDNEYKVLHYYTMEPKVQAGNKKLASFFEIMKSGTKIFHSSHDYYENLPDIDFLTSKYDTAYNAYKSGYEDANI